MKTRYFKPKSSPGFQTPIQCLLASLHFKFQVFLATEKLTLPYFTGKLFGHSKGRILRTRGRINLPGAGRAGLAECSPKHRRWVVTRQAERRCRSPSIARVAAGEATCLKSPPSLRDQPRQWAPCSCCVSHQSLPR